MAIAESGRPSKIEATFGPRYAENIERARSLRMESDELIATLNQNMTAIQRNRYNQEVYLSIAQLERHFIDTMIDLDRAEQSLIVGPWAHTSYDRPDECDQDTPDIETCRTR